MQYDNPSQDLKAGFVLKIGGNVKSWRRRYFVAKNKADNYRIVYYEDETMKKVKGYICCCGYVTLPFVLPTSPAHTLLHTSFDNL